MISIHQSQFLPWVPYFFKVLKSDVFVVLDNVQFEKNGVQNRNMIKTPQGVLWLTVPVRYKFSTLINEVEIANADKCSKILKTLKMNYGRSSFFQQVYSTVEDIFNQKLSNLHKLNMKLLDKILDMIGNKPEIYSSSSINTNKKKDDLLIEIVKHFNQNEYLSGPGALNYMDLKKFKDAGIKIFVQDFKYTEYKQLWNKQVGFLPDLSIIDLLFNDLESAPEYIMDNGKLKDVI